MAMDFLSDAVFHGTVTLDADPTLALEAVTKQYADALTPTITAGDGLTKTGDTVDVVGGTGITANADDIEVDTSVVATKSTGLIGDGSTLALTYTHNLAGGKDVLVSLRRVSDDAQVYADVVYTSTTQITVTFQDAPASNAISVTCLA